jgi:hypothetical protein
MLCGIRMRQLKSAAAHLGHPLRILQQQIHLVGHGGQLIAFHRSAVFEQEVAVALFLSGNRLIDHHWQAAAHRLSGGQPARLADVKISGLHPFIHFGGVTQHLEVEMRGGIRTLAELIEGYTRAAAYAEFQDRRKGQIKADPAPTGEKNREGYAPGTKVTLTFTPEAGSKFSRWFNFEGTVKETSEKLTVTMDRPMWIFAESKP